MRMLKLSMLVAAFAVAFGFADARPVQAGVIHAITGGDVASAGDVTEVRYRGRGHRRYGGYGRHRGHRYGGYRSRRHGGYRRGYGYGSRRSYRRHRYGGHGYGYRSYRHY